MEQKIREYVNYQFRMDNDPNKSEKIEEIVANMIERFNDLFEKYQDENKAYIETIKSLGDFEEDKIEIAKTKARFYDIFFIVSVICAIFSAVGCLFNNLIAFVLLVVSLSLYCGASAYVIKDANYIKTNELDIAKYHDVLKTIFRFLKTVFIFWGISITFITSSIVTSLAQTFFVGAAIVTSTESLFLLIIIVGVITFLIAGTCCILILQNIYKRLINYYYQETGDSNLPSYFTTVKKVLNIEENKDKNKNTNTNNLLIALKVIGGVVLLITFCTMFFTRYWLYENTIYDYNYVYESALLIASDFGLLILLLLIVNVLIYIKALRQDNLKWLIVTGLSLVTSSVTLLTVVSNYLSISGIYYIGIVFSLVYLLSLIALQTLKYKDSQKEVFSGFYKYLDVAVATAVFFELAYVKTVYDKPLLFSFEGLYLIPCLSVAAALIILIFVKNVNKLHIPLLVFNLLITFLFTVLFDGIIESYSPNGYLSIGVIATIIYLIATISFLIYKKVQNKKLQKTID